ncbi:hypothetical protein [Pontibacter sp. G13]|uniref:hypothetical protein n=1 Tax=Pontibacter sp. G13 TaxID=3074898 RepID=UPI00288B7000|nr:hypothetical protein [Pontibacter sp. G13]WNJ17592.1 hypothetical protein RJD25_22305 [Pontibacter sp. G13]
MKNRVIWCVMILMVSLSACSQYSEKEAYLARYERFMTHVEQDSRRWSSHEWQERDRELHALLADKYQKIESQLSREEKKEIWTDAFKYAVRHDKHGWTGDIEDEYESQWEKDYEFEWEEDPRYDREDRRERRDRRERTDRRDREDRVDRRHPHHGDDFDEEVFVDMLVANAEFVGDMSDLFVEDIAPELREIMPELERVTRKFARRLEERGTMDRIERRVQQWEQELKRLEREL